MAAATGAVGGKVTTIDLRRPPVNAEMLKAYVGLVDELNTIGAGSTDRPFRKWPDSETPEPGDKISAESR